MGGKGKVPPIPPPPPLPEMPDINIVAPPLPPMPAPEPLPPRSTLEEKGAPTSQEIAEKAKQEKERLKSRPGGARGTQYTGTGLLLDPEVAEENLKKPLIS